MNDLQQSDAFSKELDKLVNRFAAEFNLSYATIIGILFTKAHMMVDEWNLEDKPID